MTPSKKKISISSNSKDGSYLQTLSEAGPHTFIFQDYKVYRKEETVEIGATQKFKALKRNFTVRSVVENAPVFSVRGFETNSPSLTSDGRQKLSELAETLRLNQQLRVVLVVTPDEDQLGAIRAKNEAEYLKAMEAWKKATKKLKKKQTPPAEPQRPSEPADPNSVLMQSRMAAVRSELKDVKNGDERVVIEIGALPSSAAMATAAPAVVEPVKKGKKKTSAKPVTTAAASSSTKHATLAAKIGKVKALFD